MKTFLTSTTLILIANMALADDFYGHFNNPDRDTTLNNDYGMSFPVVGRSRDFQPSIVTFNQGNPEYPHTDESDRESRFWTAGSHGDSDYFVRHNPDSGHGGRRDSDRSGSHAQDIALDRLDDGGRS